jgi:hypothetical protein
MKTARIRNLVVLALLVLPSFTLGQVQSIAPPRNPLPAEAGSAAVTKYSFIVYGDTRGRRDGTEVQHEHSLVVDGMLAAIQRLQNTGFPVRFILQTGDAVVNGGNAQQWNTSFVGLIDKLTTDGGVPYFLPPGNHDVTAASSLESPQRQQALQNYLQAMSALIPPDGAQRRLSGYPTYAFGYGNTFFLALDSNIADDETQFDWAASQLQGLDRSRYVNVIAFFHHPIFSSGAHGGSKVEAQTAVLRARYMPLFRAHHVRALFTGHEHLFEHWVERYTDDSGLHRMDLLVTGGGGAPLSRYQGEPDTAPYVRMNASSKVQVEHLVKPGMQPGDNPYHFVIVRVDGQQMDLEITGIDWGRDFRPYRGNRSELN